MTLKKIKSTILNPQLPLAIKIIYWYWIINILTFLFYLLLKLPLVFGINTNGLQGFFGIANLEWEIFLIVALPFTLIEIYLVQGLLKMSTTSFWGSLILLIITFLIYILSIISGIGLAPAEYIWIILSMIVLYFHKEAYTQIHQDTN